MNEFYVKDGRGAEYGPIDEWTLQEWSADGRVGPGDMISRDRRSWKPAPAVEEAQLLWTIDIDGE